LDALCEAQEAVLIRLERAGVQGDLGPVMNDEMGADHWFAQPGAPFPKLDNEDEEPKPVAYAQRAHPGHELLDGRHGMRQ